MNTIENRVKYNEGLLKQADDIEAALLIIQINVDTSRTFRQIALPRHESPSYFESFSKKDLFFVISSIALALSLINSDNDIVDFVKLIYVIGVLPFGLNNPAVKMRKEQALNWWREQK